MCQEQCNLNCGHSTTYKNARISKHGGLGNFLTL